MHLPKSVQSIGHIAGELRMPVGQIRAIANFHRIDPELTIDHVPHFRSEDVVRIADYASQVRSESMRRQGIG